MSLNFLLAEVLSEYSLVSAELIVIEEFAYYFSA